MSSKNRKNVDQHAAAIRKSHNAIDDSVSSAPDIFYSSANNRKYNDGHRVFTVPEQDFLKEAYDREFDAHTANVYERTTKPNEETELTLADSMKATFNAHCIANKGLTTSKRINNNNLIKDQFDVTGLRRHRLKIETELQSLQKSITHKNACLAMSYSGDVTSLHPALQQTKLPNQQA
mmetsp:Transcript_34539/g.35208  ORF Transcript_34539/g.35208 Transcript_34539/m.35208 type:complete len:178 (+) Transcript_34539:113-646(+)